MKAASSSTKVGCAAPVALHSAVPRPKKCESPCVGRDVVAADRRRRGLRRRVRAERLAGARPALDRGAGVERRDLGGEPGDEVVVERRVVVLDHRGGRGELVADREDEAARDGSRELVDDARGERVAAAGGRRSATTPMSARNVSPGGSEPCDDLARVREAAAVDGDGPRERLALLPRGIDGERAERGDGRETVGAGERRAVDRRSTRRTRRRCGIRRRCRRPGSRCTRGGPCARRRRRPDCGRSRGCMIGVTELPPRRYALMRFVGGRRVQVAAGRVDGHALREGRERVGSRNELAGRRVDREHLVGRGGDVEVAAARVDGDGAGHARDLERREGHRRESAAVARWRSPRSSCCRRRCCSRRGSGRADRARGSRCWSRRTRRCSVERVAARRLSSSTE